MTWGSGSTLAGLPRAFSGLRAGVSGGGCEPFVNISLFREPCRVILRQRDVGVTRIPIGRDRGTAMRRRLKLLTVGLVLVTAAVAGCSSTTAGSAGAIQDDVELAASAPASSSAGPTSSPDPVGPSPAPTEAPASPVASPTDSPSLPAAVYVPADDLGGNKNTSVCDLGLEYECGDIGSSGVGTVFYASAIPFKCGQYMTSSCNYLESAPNLWAPNSQSTCELTGSACGGSNQNTSDFSGTGKGITWCTGEGAKSFISGAVNQAIGSGFSNTLAIIPTCNQGDAANAAQRYEGGRKIDWALPSWDELRALYYYPNRAAIGGFTSQPYWSSSQDSDQKDNAWAHYFDKAYSGFVYTPSKGKTLGVRPVRAF